MLIEDHFVINVAKRIRPDGQSFGPYHEHYMAVELRAPAASTRGEAIGKFTELCKHYPEPDFKCTLTQVVCRGVLLAESGTK